MKIIGSYVSPYVRKVLACLNLKGLDYEIDPITPFFGDEAFEAMSPLRRIPVLIDGDLALCDSSVICQYLEDAYPDRPILPADVKDRARARWLEEYADTRIGDVFIWGYFYPLVVAPAVFGGERDKARAQKTLAHDVPGVLDYLEGQVPDEGFLFGEIGLADISLATAFRNAAFARFTLDAARWPKTDAYIARVLDHPALARLRPFEEVSLRTPPPEQREAMRALGARIAEQTVAADRPRPGVMAV
jgi:glutathione S-transferase